MQCPACTTERLLMSDRHGIEIDYCPKCRGVWLDRGELDKIIERSAGSNAGGQPTADAGDRHAAPRYRERDDDDHDRRQHGKGYRKKSFLGEIFDFD